MSPAVRLKHLACLRTEVEDTKPRPKLDLESLESGTGRLAPEAEIRDPSEPGTGVAQVDQGDVLFGKLRPYLAKTWVADRPCFASTELLCLRPAADISSRWLGYVVASQPFIEFAVATSDGAKMPRTSWSKLAEFRLDPPDLSSQEAIADYLDRDTARLDALIAAKRRMVGLLEERIWLVFGVRVSAAKPKMMQLRRALDSVIDGPFGSAFSSREYSEDGGIVIRLGNIGFSRWRGDEVAHIPLPLYEKFVSFSVKEGDLLIAGLGDEQNHAGRACVAPDLGPAIVKGKCFRGRVNSARASAEFLALLLSSPVGAEAMNMSGRGSTRSMINLEIVKSARVPMPTKPEQESIAEETRAHQAHTAALTDTLLRQVAALQERRRSLLTAAITGMLKVPAAV